MKSQRWSWKTWTLKRRLLSYKTTNMTLIQSRIKDVSLFIFLVIYTFRPRKYRIWDLPPIYTPPENSSFSKAQKRYLFPAFWEQFQQKNNDEKWHNEPISEKYEYQDNVIE
jgi:hypothetical protein